MAESKHPIIVSELKTRQPVAEVYSGPHFLNIKCQQLNIESDIKIHTASLLRRGAWGQAAPRPHPCLAPPHPGPLVAPKATHLSCHPIHTLTAMNPKAIVLVEQAFSAHWEQLGETPLCRSVPVELMSYWVALDSDVPSAPWEPEDTHTSASPS